MTGAGTEGGISLGDGQVQGSLHGVGGLHSRVVEDLQEKVELVLHINVVDVVGHLHACCLETECCGLSVAGYVYLYC